MTSKITIVPIPEEDDASETDQVDVSETINSAVWCVALTVSIVYGIYCLISYPAIYNTKILLYYISFTMVIEIISVIVAVMIMFIWCIILR